MTPTKKSTPGSPRAGRAPVAGGEIAFEAAGTGTPILFVHSIIADQRMWNREVAKFSADHQTIRYDLRGFGRSPPATGSFSYQGDVDALLTHLHIPSAYVVGSSMGGAIAIDFALAHPEKVRGLLLAAPGLSGGFDTPFTPDEKAAFDYDEQKSNEVSAAWKKGDAARAIDLLRQLWCSALSGAARELFQTMVTENTAEVFGYRSMKLAQDAPPASKRLPGLKVPTSVLVGDRDNPSSVPFAKRIAEAIPRARLISVAGADHLVNLSRPDAFDEALLAGVRGA
jgi:3-oxoadipate enol-lactonase